MASLPLVSGITRQGRERRGLARNSVEAPLSLRLGSWLSIYGRGDPGNGTGTDASE